MAIKIVLLGQANVGKTSIGRFLRHLNRMLALETEPSTRIERYNISVLCRDIFIFVTPGQRRYKKLNINFLSDIIDENTIVFYVIDAAAEVERLKSMVIEFVMTIRYLKKIIEIKNIERLYVVLLAHKQDMPNAIKSESIIGKIKSNKKLLEKIKLEGYNTSIYHPETIFSVVDNVILSKILPMNDIYKIVETLRKMTGSKVSVISDNVGFPIAFSGDGNLTTWLSVFSAKVHASIDQEREIVKNFQKKMWEEFFKDSNGSSFELILEISAGKILYMAAQKMGKEVLYISLLNPTTNPIILRDVVKGVFQRLFFILDERAQGYAIDMV
ncbi:MAG: ADP-ribosylation factor-like protein [Candidatus Njordarchaeota archaeon]